MSETFQLREVFNTKVVNLIANSIYNVYPDFKNDEFVNYVLSKIDILSFGDRSSLITDALGKFLPKDFKQAANILYKSLGPEIEEANLTGYDRFYIMPLGIYVSRFGRNNFDTSMKLLYEMTKRFSSEWPIRTFIILEPVKSFKLLHRWVEDPNPHIRRLVSECTRSRLPLSSPLKEFITNPEPVIELLTLLNKSSELYVKRSIANNLNDISKDNPKIVTQTLNKWKNKDKSKNMQWIIQHSLRTLVKQGNVDALELLGFNKDPNIEILNFTLHSKNIIIGSKLQFEFEIINKSKDSVNLMIDYIIHFMKYNGKTKQKVFKLSKKKLTSKESLKINKNHMITQLSTRKIYQGEHQIQLQINGMKGNLLKFIVRK
ncbi:MAG: hypothetical protein HeimC2_25570 [Candidatus Heimdallarchaeota archaeon LC_2]|nr:MAG: hypothetical protein HeimC2_25570 [Candidatus Heimdallarchaeota archaeon LC_2]